MKSLKIVIITSTIYPLNSPRSFRSTELAKELARLGHQVTLYALLGNYDYSQFCADTGIKVKSYTNSFWGNKNSDGEFKLGITRRILIKLLGRVLDYPAMEYIFKVKKALRSETQFDYLISIAHPFPIHWGVLYFLSTNNKNFNVWTSDCGDPFMGNPYVKYPFYFKYIERYWCRKTDFITIPINEAKQGYFDECKNKLKVIPQGFDFSNLELRKYIGNKVPTFAYAGNVYEKFRDPTIFLEYLTDVKYDFKFIVYTHSKSFFEVYQKRLGSKMEIKDFIPREDLLKELSTTDFLINITDRFALQQPSKLIDYALTKRPILQLSSQFKEQKSFTEFMNGEYVNQFILLNLESYNIKNVAENFTKLYNDKTSKL